MKDFNPDEFVFFVLKTEFIHRASSGFVLSYYDKESGDDFMYKDFKGNALKYSFNKSHRMIRVPSRKKDLVEAIRNHPQCHNSKNGSYRKIGSENIQSGVLFSEMNNQKDAQSSVSIAKTRSDAMTRAFEIFEDKALTEEVSLVLGISETGSMSHAKIILYVESNPSDFLKEVNSADFKMKAIAKKAIDQEILYREGVFLKCGDFTYGTELDDVIKTLISDKDKLFLLEKKLGLN